MGKMKVAWFVCLWHFVVDWLVAAQHPPRPLRMSLSQKEGWRERRKMDKILRMDLGRKKKQLLPSHVPLEMQKVSLR